MNVTSYWEDYIGQETEEFESVAVMDGPDVVVSEKIEDIAEQVKTFRRRYGKSVRIVLIK